MTLDQKIARLRAEVACRVRERAAIIHEACPGISWATADARAYAEEASGQRSLPLGPGFSADVDPLAKVF